MVLKCDLKTVENECSSFSLLEPLVGILLIWKLNLPKDILGMEINTVIRGWERDQMRIWQDVRVKMDLLKLDSLLKDTQWSSKETSYLHVMHWEQAPPFQKGVTPWEWHDSCLLRPRSAKRNRNAQKKTGLLIEKRPCGAHKTFICFVSVPSVAQEIHSNLSFASTAPFYKPYLIWAAKANLLSLTIKVTRSSRRSSAGCMCVFEFSGEESWY